MKRQRSIIAIFLGLFAAATGAYAAPSFLNAPHNEPNNVGCGNCHTYPFSNWIGLPPPTSIDDTVKNFVCRQCHDGSTSAPLEKTHSSLNTSTGHGAWTLECVNCHDPHFQAQLEYYQTDASSLYLATGSYDSVLVTGTTPQNTISTITYTLDTAPTNPIWSDTSRWGTKTSTGRGLILVADHSAPYATFEVVDANASQIQVAGNVGEVPLGTTWGLIYGQLIRSQVVNRQGAEVATKFFDPNGGYTRSTAPYDGICQVCHTQTTHWTATGGDRTHNPGTNCTSCHRHPDGLKGSAPNHSLFLVKTTGGSCEACHDRSGTAKVMENVHKSKCDSCHDLANNYALKTGPNGWGDATKHKKGSTSTCSVCHASRATDFMNHVIPTTLGWHEAKGHLANYTYNPATDGGQTGNCFNCHHGNNGTDIATQVHITNKCAGCHTAVTGVLKKHPTSPSPSAPGDCATCHSDRVPNHANHILMGVVTGAADCTGCHDKNNLNSDAQFIATVHNLSGRGCGTCHVNPQGGGPLQNYSGTNCGNSITGNCVNYEGINLGHGGSCTTCHGIYFPNHKHPNHSTVVAQYDNCAGCHAATAGATTGIAVSAADDKLHDACDTCHNTNGSLRTPYGLATAITPGTCATCHGEYFPRHTHHTLHNEVSYDPTGGDTSQSTRTGCASCHNDSGGNLATWIDILKEHDLDGVKDGSTNSCANCHSYAGTKSAPLAAVQSAIATAGPQHCRSCHTDKVPVVNHGGHTETDFPWNTTTQATCGTATCHNAAANTNVVANIHGNKCTLCHATSSGGNGTTILGARGLGDARLGSATSPHGDSCLVCHGAGYMENATTSAWDIGARTVTTYGGKHHNNVHAQAGDCGWCHEDPRPGWATQYGLTAPTGGPPKQLACRACHTNFAVAGNDLIIYENWFSDRHRTDGATPYDSHQAYTTTTTVWNAANNLTLNGKQPKVQQREVHRIPALGASKINVYDYGICFSCHNGTKAQKVNVWHAKQATTEVPVASDAASNGYNLHFDVLRDHMGRNYFGIFRGTGMAGDLVNGLPTYSHAVGFYDTSGDALTRGKTLNSRNIDWQPAAQKLTFTTAPNIPVNASINNAENLAVGTSTPLPRFADIAAPTFSGSIALSASSYSVAENVATVTITATRTGGTSGAVGVSYATSNGTATAGSDYTTASGTLSWAAGDAANKTFTITILNDSVYEPDETVNITLSNPTGGATLGGLATAVLTIINDDAANPAGTIALSAATYSVAENGGSVTITATRTGGTSGAVGISYATANGTATAGADYTAASGALSWTAGDAAVKTFTIAITNDTAVEGNETVNITLSNPTGGAALGSPATAVLTITDDDTPVGVATLNAWTDIASSAPNNTGGTVAAGNITVGSGSNRLLLVAVVMETLSNSTPTVSATLGGTALTQIKMTTTSGREHAWMGYLKDTQIGTGTKALSVTYSNATGNASGLHVKWASYSGVNQTTPLASSAAANTGTTTVTFGNTITYAANGMTVAVSGNGGSPATGALSATPAFTAGTVAQTNGHSSNSFTTAKHTAAGSYASTTTVTWSGTTSARSALVVASLQP